MTQMYKPESAGVGGGLEEAVWAPLKDHLQRLVSEKVDAAHLVKVRLGDSRWVL